MVGTKKSLLDPYLLTFQVGTAASGTSHKAHNRPQAMELISLSCPPYEARFAVSICVLSDSGAIASQRSINYATEVSLVPDIPLIRFSGAHPK